MPSSGKRIASLTSGGSGISRGSSKRSLTSEENKKSNAAVKRCREKKKKSEEYWKGKIGKIKLAHERADFTNRCLEFQILYASGHLRQAQQIRDSRKGLCSATTEDILNQAETDVDAIVTEVNRIATALYPEPSIEEFGIPSVVSNASDDTSDYQNTWNGSSFSNMDDVYLGTSGNQPFTNFTSNENAGVSSVVSNASEDASASNENAGVSSVASNTLEDASASNENAGVSSAVSNTLEDASASDCQNTWKNLEENQESVISAPNNAFASEDMHFEASGAQINQDFTFIDDGNAAFVERLLKTPDFV